MAVTVPVWLAWIMAAVVLNESFHQACVGELSLGRKHVTMRQRWKYTRRYSITLCNSCDFHLVPHIKSSEFKSRKIIARLMYRATNIPHWRRSISSRKKDECGSSTFDTVFASQTAFQGQWWRIIHFLCDRLTWNGFSMFVSTMIVSLGFGLGIEGFNSNLMFCTNMVKKMNMLSFASDSPRQILFPIPNGVNWKLFFTCL